MRIVIDLQGAQTESRFRGIGRYSLSFAKAIVRNRGEHEVIIALNGVFANTIEPLRAEFDEILPSCNIRVWQGLMPVRESNVNNSWRRAAAEFVREAFLASLRPDIIHITSLFEGYTDDAVTSIGVYDAATPVSVSSYDLIPLLNSDVYLKPKPVYEAYYNRKIKGLKRASLLLAISEYSKQELFDVLGDDIAPVVSVFAAAEESFQPLSIDKTQKISICDKFGLLAHFVLYTGGADERKNLPRLINAYADIPLRRRAGSQLVIAGRFPELFKLRLIKLANECGLQSTDLIFTGYVTEDELTILYNLCTVYVFPSWHEGFGLPALEAMSCGAAVIASNVTSLPEVIDNDEALFDPFSVKQIADKIEWALNDESFRERLVTHGLKQAKRYSWDNTAKAALNAFEECHRNRDPTNIEQENLVSVVTSPRISVVSPLESDFIQLAKAIDINRYYNRKPSLYVDVSQIILDDYKTGIQRVVRSVFHEWVKAFPDNITLHPVYLSNKTGSWRYHYASYKSCNVEPYSLVDAIVEPSFGDVFLGLDLYSFVSNAVDEGLFDDWKNRGVQINFVVYDILPIRNPHWWPQGGAEAHERWLRCISQVSDCLISISESVSHDVQTWVESNGVKRLRPIKYRWFHLGADINISEQMIDPDEMVELFYELRKRKTFLMVGTIEPRKGHSQVVEAFESLWMNGVDVNLIVVGKRGWMVDKIVNKIESHSELGQRLFWFDRLSDVLLEKVYKASDCLIAASEGEGFGLPVIEAAQRNLPVIARDIPIFQEVAGRHAFYFEAEGAKQLASKIEDWLDLYSRRCHPLSGEMPWLTWAESAGRLLVCLDVSLYK